ncbi:MAG TPA: glycosyltransferase family 4 protein [Bacteroidia bacterium]|nr:glycosyltransferase family 4 protein [Bacteroidia bacterium]
MIALFKTGMNILYIGTLHPHPGGSAISGSQIVTHLAKRDHKVFAIAPITDTDAANLSHFNSLIPKTTIFRYTVPYYNTSTHSQFSHEYSNKERNSILSILPSVLIKCDPDIIMLGRETFIWDIPKAVKNHKAKVVLRVAGATTLGIFNNTLPQDVAEMFLTEYRKSDLLITPANHILKHLKSVGINNCVHIPNAVNTSKFSPSENGMSIKDRYSIPHQNVVVSHISGLESIKRPMDFILAAEGILKRKKNVTFLIIGNGPCYYEMTSYCKEKNIENDFRFTGWIDYEIVNTYFAATDIVVMPCETDTQPRVYLEAMSSGCALIASSIDASKEIINDRRTGVLYKSGDIFQLSAAIEDLIDNPILRHNLQVSARDYIINNHKWDSITSLYENNFENLLKSYL